MQATATKWGNSIGIRIPAAFAKQLRIIQGDSLTVSLSKETIVLRRVSQRTSLSDLLIGITDSNLHNEIETEIIGNEIW